MEGAFSMLLSKFSSDLLGVKNISYLGLIASSAYEVLRRSCSLGSLGDFAYSSTSEYDNFLGVFCAESLGLFCLNSPANSVATSRCIDCVCLDILNFSKPSRATSLVPNYLKLSCVCLTYY